MIGCCRKCSKIFCKKRNQISDCPNCVSYVLLSIQNINKKLKENYNDRI